MFLLIARKIMYNKVQTEYSHVVVHTAIIDSYLIVNYGLWAVGVYTVVVCP